MAGALRIAVTRLTRRLRAERADHSLTLSQISALSSLDHHGPLSPTALAELERVQPPSMTRVISALEHRAFAIRAPHHSDRRRSVIAITDKGKSVLEENRRRRDAWLAKVLEELSPDERQALARAIPVLERIGRF
ncbi:MAG: MarR family transcriptional regulator [Acidimicrobiaceae bacterium]|nr:MarR family transcriptional regulator [Acidimicrobiaceae bacterium]